MIFNTDFKDVIFQLIAFFLRKPNFLKLIFSGIKPLKTLNDDGVIVESFGQKNSSLNQFQLFIRNFLNFDARTIFLEKFLNDIYDSAQKRIKIVNSTVIPTLAIFNKIEEREDVFFYNNFDSTISYVVGEFSVFENKVFKANATNNSPSTSPPDTNFWDFEKDITFIFNFADEFPFDYRIEIPLVVTLQPDYSDDRIKSQINQLNSAGRTFEGVEKEDITNQLFNSNE